jgi:hypothetical protein
VYLLPNPVDFQMAESRKSVILVVEDDPGDLELLFGTFGKVAITNPVEVARDESRESREGLKPDRLAAAVSRCIGQGRVSGSGYCSIRLEFDGRLNLG